MKIERAMELLNQIIDHVSVAENSHETIKQLLEMGFTSDELINEFGWSLIDVKEVEEYLECDDSFGDWSYEIGQTVQTCSMDGANETDVFEIVDRKYIPNEGEYYWLKRISDGEVWEWVGCCTIIE